MTTLYFDIFSGISGDMFLGALLDLGVEFRKLEAELARLDLRAYHLHVTRGQRLGISGTKFDVHLESDHHHDHRDDHGHAHAHDHEPVHSHGQHHHQPPASSHAPASLHSHSHGQTFAEIREIISRSPLSDWVKSRALAVFQRVADAEGKIHGQPPDQVHFHEVGAIDSIVDIVGAAVALELLGRPRVLAAPVVEGHGWVTCAHGRFPIPAPATLEILSARGVTVSQCDEPHELVTPTGAALLAEFAEGFGPMRGLAVRRVAYGLGRREHQTRPNVLRVLLCDEAAPGGAHDWETDTVTMLQTNLDDLSPELLGQFMENALAAGALDVFYTPVQMKKNRPGTLLSVLCAEAEADKLSELILRETTAFGVRRLVAERRKLRREFRTVATPYGSVTVKIGTLDGRVVQAAPEFESCRVLADQANVPLKAIYEAAARAVL
jgi:pyridinium-3,5-bisthiocarboxylic acid mononucleotide nickel chelatase